MINPVCNPLPGCNSITKRLLHDAGHFLVIQKTRCTMQDTFWSSRKPAARCRTLSGYPENLLHDAGHVLVIQKTCCTMQDTFWSNWKNIANTGK